MKAIAIDWRCGYLLVIDSRPSHRTRVLQLMEELLVRVEELEELLLQKDEDLRLAAEIGQQLISDSLV